MKIILTILAFVYLNANATNYYFSSTGSDGAAGTSQGTAWQTPTKFNSSFAGFSPGDSILFKRGDTFYGSLTISKSGSSGSPIIIGAYGTGAKPIITGFTTVSAWTNLGSNIWVSNSAVSALAYTNVVNINGVNTAMGRYPNTGYLTYQTFVTNTTITSSSLNSAITNWTGGEVVIKKQRWIIDRNPITAHSGGTLTYTASSSYYGQDNWGFFIQKDSLALDLQDEWYYSPSKKIKIYSTSSPTGVNVATIDTLVVCQTGKSYVTFDNISFTGANFAAIYTVNFSHLTIQNCSFDFNYNGVYGDDLGTSPNFVFNNNTVNHTNNNALTLWVVYSGAIITNNIIKNTAMLVGMGGSSDGNYFGMYLAGDAQTGTLIQYNEVDSTGYIPILYTGTSGTMSNNLVDYFCSVKDDGGGLYTHSAGTLKTISYNTVLNGIGNNEGIVDAGVPVFCFGIYIDRNSSTNNVSILNNSVSNPGYAGIFINGAQTGTIIRNNTVYNALHTSLYISAETGFTTATIKNNIFFARTATQLAFHEYPRELVTPNITSDSNYFARPIADSLVFAAVTTTPGYDYQEYTLAGWQVYSSQDAHSHKSPKTITNVYDLRFDYNATSYNKTICLDANYMDVRGATYSGTLILAPYTSIVLIQNGALY